MEKYTTSFRATVCADAKCGFDGYDVFHVNSLYGPCGKHRGLSRRKTWLYIGLKDIANHDVRQGVSLCVDSVCELDSENHH